MTSSALAVIASALLTAGLAVSVPASQSAAQEATGVEIIEIGIDRNDRLTVPVRIGVNGPYRFLIDTGAERTVLARALAERLALRPAGRATLMGVAGSLEVDLVEVDQVTLGRRSFYGLSAPLLEGRHIGADGIIGLDGLQEQRVLLDFRKGLMAVDDAARLGGSRGFEIVVRARRRSGQLIITDATVDGVSTQVVIDTGAQSTIANRALQRSLSKRRKLTQTALYSVTGQKIMADIGTARRLRIGTIELADVRLAFADAPPFKKLGLADKPAMLMGMNELRAFKRVAIDFESRRVLFDLPDEAMGIRLN